MHSKNYQSSESSLLYREEMNGERGPRIKNNIRCFLPAPYTKVSIAAGKSSHLSSLQGYTFRLGGVASSLRSIQHVD